MATACQLFNICMVFPLPNQKSQKLSQLVQHHLQQLKNIIASHIALVVPLYLFKDGFKIIRGLQTQIGGHSSGDLTVGSRGDSVGDWAGGLGIGDTDITIWGGLYEVGPLALLVVPGVPWGLSLDRDLSFVAVHLSCYTVPLWPLPSCSQGFSWFPLLQQSWPWQHYGQVMPGVWIGEIIARLLSQYFFKTNNKS